MERLYIDESGTMTVKFCGTHPYFIIAIVRVRDAKKLKKAYKRFVSKNLSKLRAADKRGRMFRNGKFSELKGVSPEYCGICTSYSLPSIITYAPLTSSPSLKLTIFLTPFVFYFYIAFSKFIYRYCLIII